MIDWLVDRFTGWIRRHVGAPEPDAFPHHHDRQSAPAVALSGTEITAWQVDCARQLLGRHRHADAVACLLDALRRDFDGAAAAVQAVAGGGAAALRTCLAICRDTLTAAAAGTPTWGRPPPLAPVRSVSVVICSINDARFAAVSADYAVALAGGPFEIIRIADALSLAEGYNRGFAQSTGEIVVFSHDDVRILAPTFRVELTSALEHYDIVGVAGTTRLAGPQWFSGPPTERRQFICYPAGTFGTAEASCAFEGCGDERWSGGIQALDGVFLAARRAVLNVVTFDERRYDGFHFYDLDFSYRAHLAGFRLSVCPRLGIMHASLGSYGSESWRHYAHRFCEQYGLSIAGLPPSLTINFAGEAQLGEFLAAMFAWQDARAADASDTAALPSVGVMKTLLHVGCGPLRRESTGPGFQADDWREIRLDADPAVAPDIVGSLTDMAAVASGSVDAVFSSHTLEHLYLHEVPLALAEIRRVLKPAGVTVAWVPDLRAAARLIAEDRLFETIGMSPGGAITPFDIVYSHRAMVGRDRPWMAHHCGFTRSTLTAAHLDAGFACAVAEPRVEGFDMQVLATPWPVPLSLLSALAALHFQR